MLIYPPSILQGLEEPLSKADDYKARWEECVPTLREERQLAEEAAVRAQETSQQQAKLIHFLHAKLDDEMKKVRGVRVFGSS